MSCLHAQQPVIAAHQGVFVHKLCLLPPEKGAPGGHIGGQHRVLRQLAAEPAQVGGGGDLSLFRKTGGAGEYGAAKPQLKAPGVHVHDKLLLRAGYRLRQGNRCVVGVADDHAPEQIPHRHLFSGHQPDGGTLLGIRRRGGSHCRIL